MSSLRSQKAHYRNKPHFLRKMGLFNIQIMFKGDYSFSSAAFSPFESSDSVVSLAFFTS